MTESEITTKYTVPGQVPGLLVLVKSHICYTIPLARLLTLKSCLSVGEMMVDGTEGQPRIFIHICTWDLEPKDKNEWQVFRSFKIIFTMFLSLLNTD